MPEIVTKIAVGSSAYLANREATLACLEHVRTITQRAVAASNEARTKFESRGQLLPRERLALLLDTEASFLELSSLAGYRLDSEHAERSIAGGGLVTGIGFISGVRCMISVSDSAIDAGALRPKGLDKMLRAQELSLENRLPFVQLVENTGANLVSYKVEDFVKGGALFRNLARISAAGLPIVTITHGASTAGGAYRTGLSDYNILVRGRSLVSLAGPPLLRAATGEIAGEEELGGADMHCTVSGLGDYLAEDDRHAIGVARDLISKLNWMPHNSAANHNGVKPPLYEAEELLGVMPPDHKQPVDMMEVIARIVDGSDFLAIGESYGPSTICGHAAIYGQPVGIITNNGPLDPAGATKATHFIQSCCQLQKPILYLVNTTGFLVGRAYEQAGIIKHGSKMIQAVTNATVPQITLYCGASFGAGHFAMCGRAFAPRFCFSWPNSKIGVMGGEQAARTMAIVSEASMKRKGEGVDDEKLAALQKKIVDRFDRQMDVFTTSAHVLDDGVIDPRDTRAVISELLAICREADGRHVQPMQFGVARP